MRHLSVALHDPFVPLDWFETFHRSSLSAHPRHSTRPCYSRLRIVRGPTRPSTIIPALNTLSRDSTSSSASCGLLQFKLYTPLRRQVFFFHSSLSPTQEELLPSD
jgi:hypothetical protein